MCKKNYFGGGLKLMIRGEKSKLKKIFNSCYKDNHNGQRSPYPFRKH